MTANDNYLQISSANIQVDIPHIRIDDSHSNNKFNDLHLTGDLLASGEDSLRFVPDFSLDDPSLNIRKPKEEIQKPPVEEKKNNSDSSFGKVTPDTMFQKVGT